MKGEKVVASNNQTHPLTDAAQEYSGDTPKVLRFLRDIDRLHDCIRTAETDVEFSSSGQLFYSVDTNVLEMFIKPREMGFGNSNRRGYTHIFRDDPPSVAWSVAQEVSEQIFFPHSTTSEAYSADAARTLLLLPGIDSEIFPMLARILNTDAGKAQEARALVSETPTKDHLQELSKLESESKYKYLRENLPEIWDLLFGPDGASKKAKRIEALAKAASIISVRSLSASHFNLFPPEMLDVIQRAGTVQASVERRSEIIVVVRRVLENVFRESPLKSRSPATERADAKRLDNDITAIAWLIHTNEALAAKSFRIAHITAAERILRACRHLFVDEAGVFLGSSPRVGSTSVANAYIRHPLQFWKSKVDSRIEGVSRDAGGISDIRTDWLSLLLPTRFIGVSSVTNSDMETLSKYLPRTSPQIRSFRDRWQTFSSLLIAKYATHLDAASTRIDEIFSDIDKQIKVTTDDLLVSSVQLGLKFLVGSNNDTSARMPPKIIFDSNVTAHIAVQSILNALSNRTEPDTGAVFRQAFDDLRSSKSHPYFFELSMATVYASEQQYRAASVLGMRSLDIARSLSDSEAAEFGITGREAYYLMAICTRILARSVEDFRRSELFLTLAKRALERDTAVNPDLGVTVARFLAEDAARAVGQFLFLQTREYDQVGEGVLSLVRAISKQLENHAYGSRELELAKGISLRLLVNELTIMIHDPKVVQRISQSREAAGEFLRGVESAECILKSQRDTGSKISFLHLTIVGVAGAILRATLGQSGYRENELASSGIASLLSDEGIEANSVTVYDRRRFLIMRELFLKYSED
jgi:hypothetical protein